MTRLIAQVGSILPFGYFFFVRSAGNNILNLTDCIDFSGVGS